MTRIPNTINKIANPAVRSPRPQRPSLSIVTCVCVLSYSGSSTRSPQNLTDCHFTCQECMTASGFLVRRDMSLCCQIVKVCNTSQSLSENRSTCQDDETAEAFLVLVCEEIYSVCRSVKVTCAVCRTQQIVNSFSGIQKPRWHS